MKFFSRCKGNSNIFSVWYLDLSDACSSTLFLEECAHSCKNDNLVFQVSPMLPLPPPPPGLPPTSASNQSKGTSEDDAGNLLDNREIDKLAPPPPPPPGPRPAIIPTLPPDVLPPGVSRFPPNPLSTPGLAPQGTLSGVVVPLMLRPPYGPPPGPPSMMRPPLPPGPPPIVQQGELVPPKPSYVKSAAPTVVKRPLAQHTPELTSMVSVPAHDQSC